ncbi:hypothetical protein [Aliikangiella coralliicola]|uniref:Uncharacterized protein n=1 Tax=Aliikangiella coralliicola TaxID=2592383 RepID=A0A545UE83_9GAMM|nr:hypothetical protein [Aliikangiella coralliicola]TQV87786.1 hypothetical protein FLL46_10390 [Aliikangiella coralliicola]
MKKLIFASLAILFLININISDAARPHNDEYFMVCKNCSHTQARTKARNKMEANYNQWYVTGPKFYVFTDTSSNYGYTFDGVKEENFVIMSPGTPSKKGRDYLRQMHEYLVAYRKMISNAQKEMDNHFLAEKGYSVSKISPRSINDDDELTGECSSTSGGGGTPFTYFSGNNRMEINGQLNVALSNWSPGVSYAFNSISVTIGKTPNVQIGLALSNESRALEMYYSNGGRLRFDVIKDGGAWTTRLALDGSMIGNGMSRRDDYPSGYGPSLSQFVGRDSKGNYYIKDMSNVTFENNCMEQDFKAMVQALGAKIVNDPSSEGNHDDPFGPVCDTATQTSTTYYWREWVQTSSFRNGVITIGGYWDTRSVTITPGSSHPCRP